MRSIVRSSPSGVSALIGGCLALAIAQSVLPCPRSDGAAKPGIDSSGAGQDVPNYELPPPTSYLYQDQAPLRWVANAEPESTWAQERNACVFTLPTEWRACVDAVDARHGIPVTRPHDYSPFGPNVPFLHLAQD